MHYCLRHMEEPSSAQCRSCKGTFCSRCLVYSFGPRKPPYCVGCALHASGIRSGSRQVAFPGDPGAVEPPASDRGGFDHHRPAPAADQAPASAPKGWRAGRAARKAGKTGPVHHAVAVPALGGMAVPTQFGEDPFEAASIAPLPAPDFDDTTAVASPSQLQLSGPRGSGYASDPYDL